MKKPVLLCLLCAVLALSCEAPQTHYDIDSTASLKGTDVFQPDWENIASNYTFPEWFTDAKFGIFIHWGIYSVPAFANEWYSRNMYQKGTPEYEHHREVYGDHTQFGYKDFIPMFTAEKFDADEWAGIFKEAGAKYIIPVAEHHDGFAMYDSELNPWNSVKMGPKRDIIGELKAAFEKQGLIFGVSSHRAENAWFFNGGMEFPSDVQDTTITLYGRRYAQEAYTEDQAREWLEHTYELVVKYQPKLVYFDWTVNNPVLMPYMNRFLAFYYNTAIDWNEGVVVNTKQGYPTDVLVWDVERGKSGNMMQFPWQTDTSIGTKSWGYLPDEVNKTPGQIVDDLVDIVSKNGNMLLNVGPHPDGSITDEQQAILRSIGAWLKVNGEAIYGTRCWKKSGESVTAGVKGSFSDNQIINYTAQDIRFTTKGNDFYAISLEWPEDGKVTITSLTPEIIADATVKSVTLLGSEGELDWEQKEEGLVISYPETKPCDFAYSVKISFDKPVGTNLASEASNTVMKHGGE